METLNAIGLYFYYVGVDGDYRNDWITHISNPDLQDAVMSVGKFIAVTLGLN
jgi:hypothetical protein